MKFHLSVRQEPSYLLPKHALSHSTAQLVKAIIGKVRQLPRHSQPFSHLCIPLPIMRLFHGGQRCPR